MRSFFGFSGSPEASPLSPKVIPDLDVNAQVGISQLANVMRMRSTAGADPLAREYLHVGRPMSDDYNSPGSGLSNYSDAPSLPEHAVGRPQHTVPGQGDLRGSPFRCLSGAMSNGHAVLPKVTAQLAASTPLSQLQSRRAPNGGSFIQAQAEDAKAHWHQLREALLLQSHLLRSAIDSQVDAYVIRRTTLAHGQNSSAKIIMDRLETQLAGYGSSNFLLRPAAADQAAMTEAGLEEQAEAVRGEWEAILYTQQRVAEELRAVLSHLRAAAMEGGTPAVALLPVLLRGCVDGLTGEGDSWVDAEVDFLMEAARLLPEQEASQALPPATPSTGSRAPADGLVLQDAQDLQRLGQLEFLLANLGPHLTGVDANAPAVDESKEARPVQSSKSTASGITTSAGSFSHAHQGSTGSLMSSVSQRPPRQVAGSSVAGSDAASQSRFLLAASKNSQTPQGSKLTSRRSASCEPDAAASPLSNQLQELVQQLAQQKDELARELRDAEAQKRRSSGGDNKQNGEQKRAALCIRVRSEAAALTARSETLRPEVKRFRNERRSANLQVSKLLNRVLELREQIVVEQITEERLEAALNGQTIFGSAEGTALAQLSPAFAASEKELRQELADTYERLAAKGMLKLEVNALQQRCSALQKDGALHSFPPEQRLMYTVMKDGRQVELTSKVHQQDAEIVEMKWRLQQMQQQQALSRQSSAAGSIAAEHVLRN